MKLHLHLTVCGLALLSGTGVTPAAAQGVPAGTDQNAGERSGGGAAVVSGAEPAQDAAAEGDGDIVVTGIRRSLQQAAQIKRDAPQVLDVITAEDVGKLPDANVAEALQRITGVQITRVFGEGQAVSVRGLQQVRVEVDGRTLLAYSARLSPPENEQLGRSSGLDSVPSSVFGRLEVRKSPLASQVEGGLGGSVNLVTPKPFDFREATVSMRAAGVYSENSEKFEPTVTGLVTSKFADGRFGVLLSAEYQKRTSLTQTLERNNFFDRRNGGTTALQAPQLLQYESFVVDRTRLGVNGSLQFQATPEFVLTAEGLFSKLTTGRVQDFLAFRLPNSATAQIITNPVVQDNFIVAGTTNGTLTTAGQIRNEPTKNYLFALNGKYDGGALTMEGDVSFSRGTIDQTIQIITLQGRALVPGTFDFRAGVVPSLVLGTTAAPFDATNVANFNPAGNGVRSNRLLGVLEEWVGKFDVSYKVNDAITLHTGLRYADLRSTSNAFRSQVTPTIAELQPYLRTTTNFAPGIPGNFPRSFLSTAPTYDYVFNRAQAAQPNPAVPGGLLPNAQRDYELNEKTYAGYLMFSAEQDVFGMPARANAGVRVVGTDFSVDTLLQSGTTALPIFTPITDTNTYITVLPSANIAFNVTDRFLVRASVSQTMQRAGIAELAPSLFVNVINNVASGGNAALEPPTSLNADLSFEFYTGRTSLISGAVFYKDVSNFIASNTTLTVFPGFEEAGPIPYTRPDNVSSARIKGFELGIQQFFDFLPSPLDGLGMIANYTYSDAEDSAGFPLVATSKNSYNLIGLYEKGPVSARVAYNYRDEAVFEFTEGRPSFVGPRSQLDAQLGFDLSKGFGLQFQAQNLIPTKSATVEYSLIGPVALNSYALSERRYSVGVRARF
jgi:iron complex outermembrane receptor protein